MKRYILLCFVVVLAVFSATGQEVLNLYKGVPPGNEGTAPEEKVTKNAQGVITGYSDVSVPTMTVYLPTPEKATGTAVVILPGGGLRFLSWEMEGTKLAQWLNERGIAAFVLKYRLFTSAMKSAPVAGAQPLRVSVFEADKLVNANANPSNDVQVTKVLNMAANDARVALKMIRDNASKWKINPDKVGCVGFSAGGGVELSAAFNNSDKYSMPNFLGTLYGPALADVVVPSPAPPLFIGTAADHGNVAAGCLALFEAWKKAGGSAEIHLYGKGRAGFGMNQQNLPSDGWVESFYTWLKSEGF